MAVVAEYHYVELFPGREKFNIRIKQTTVNKSMTL
jgi:hypothetical protein